MEQRTRVEHGSLADYFVVLFTMFLFVHQMVLFTAFLCQPPESCVSAPGFCGLLQQLEPSFSYLKGIRAVAPPEAWGSGAWVDAEEAGPVAVTGEVGDGGEQEAGMAAAVIPARRGLQCHLTGGQDHVGGFHAQAVWDVNRS